MLKPEIPANLPTKREHLDVPVAIAGVYRYVEDKYFYRLSPGGVVLNRTRDAMRAGNKVALSTSIDLDDWFRTMAAATGAERKELLRLRATDRIAITPSA
jgi:hypothetical protein